MADIKNRYTEKQQLSEGVYVFEDGNKAWGGECNYNFELLNALLTNKTLTIKLNGQTIGTFNPRLNGEVDIPISTATAEDIDAIFED